MSKRVENDLADAQTTKKASPVKDEREAKPEDERRTTFPWRNTTGALYANYIVTPTVLILISIAFMYYTANEEGDKTSNTPGAGMPMKNEKALLTEEELALHDGTISGKNIYIAILGKVFDVEKGRRFYGPGTGYHVFAGRDSTPSFVTGKFDKTSATDDVTGLTQEEMLGIKDWIEFYRKDYTYVGKVIGRYYNEQGKPTAALKEAMQLAREGKQLKERQKEENSKFPGCNSKWSQAEGAKVWCSKDSAGIHRNWVGVPRQLFKPGSKDPRCICARTTGPSSDTGEGSEGDLNHPNLKIYPGCGVLDVSCKI